MTLDQLFLDASLYGRVGPDFEADGVIRSPVSCVLSDYTDSATFEAPGGDVRNLGNALLPGSEAMMPTGPVIVGPDSIAKVRFEIGWLGVCGDSWCDGTAYPGTYRVTYVIKERSGAVVAKAESTLDVPVQLP